MKLAMEESQMVSAHFEKVNCDCCGSEKSVRIPYFSVPSFEKTLALRRCLNCGLVYQSPRLNKMGLKMLYDQSYFEQGEFGGKDKNRSYFDKLERKDLERFNQTIIAKIRKLKPPPAMMLEIGCAGGHFLVQAREQGYEVKGIEISAYAAEEARSRYGLDVTNGEMEDVSLKDSYFDIIYAKDVLEHMPSPRIFLQQCHRKLKPDGLLVILVPNYIHSFMMRVYAFIWRYIPWLRNILWRSRGGVILNKPYHLYEFTPHTLTRLISSQEFRIIAQDIYTLKPLEDASMKGIVGRVRLFARQCFFYLVTWGLLSGDRLDIYCTPKSEKPNGRSH